MTALKKIINFKLYRGKLEYILVKDWKPEKKTICDVKCDVCLESPQIILNSLDKIEFISEKEENVNTFHEKNSRIEKIIDYGVSVDHGPPFKYIGENPIEKDEEWTVLECNDFISVSVGNVTHLSHDMISTPHAHWSDGYLDLTIARDMKRTEAVKKKFIYLFLNFLIFIRFQCLPNSKKESM